VLREATSFLLMEENITSEGLFRIPAHSKLREVLKEAYDRGQRYIVWKDNGVTLPVPAYPEAEHQDEILAEVDPKDAYSVFMAAALIKAWYSSLRQPIFPSESYRDLKRLFGDSQQVPDLEQLRDLFSPSSEWSFLPAISREIVVRHLLPLLDAVAARQEQNKMTAENLAVCFAPALLCGPDQIEDAKMSSIIRRIFTYAVDMWDHGLREACGQEVSAFSEALKLPADMSEWEDPVEVQRGDSRVSIDEQMSGITLQDNEKAPEPYTDAYPQATSSATKPPPLPPRSRVPSTKSSGDSVVRKPAPPLAVPPRYSTVISDAPEGVAESPITMAATTDGFSPRRNEFDAAPQATHPDEKKSGTTVQVPILASPSAAQEAKPSAAPAPQIILPKRKALTPAQVDNAEKSVVKQDEARSFSEYGLDRFFPQGQALPGLADLPGINTKGDAKRWMSPSSHTQSETTSPATTFSPTAFDAKPASATEPRRPSVPFNNYTPQITGLARPVYPAPPPSTTTRHPLTGRPPSKSTSLPVPTTTKPRAVSPGLLKRMPSLEQTNKNRTESQERLAPKKLNLKKASVEDLRKLYEERAGTANVLESVSRQRSLSVSPSIRE
jgi:Rho GTPase-activating protein 1